MLAQTNSERNFKVEACLCSLLYSPFPPSLSQYTVASVCILSLELGVSYQVLAPKHLYIKIQKVGVLFRLLFQDSGTAKNGSNIFYTLISAISQFDHQRTLRSSMFKWIKVAVRGLNSFIQSGTFSQRNIEEKCE